jgi:hypothetical protein
MGIVQEMNIYGTTFRDEHKGAVVESNMQVVPDTRNILAIASEAVGGKVLVRVVKLHSIIGELFGDVSKQESNYIGPRPSVTIKYTYEPVN